MGVAVYPRLGELLAAQRMSVAELERQFEQRYGLEGDVKTLYRLTHHRPVQRADIEVTGAAAAVLGVGLDDLFDVQAVPTVGGQREEAPVLDPEPSRRLAQLFDAQSRRPLTPAERGEVEALVSAFGRRLHDLRVNEIAAQHGVSVDHAEADVAAGLEQALRWWRAVEADPRNRRALERRARARRKREIVAAG